MNVARCHLLVLLSLIACTSERDTDENAQYANVVAFDTARIRLIGKRDTTTVTVELAKTRAQQTMGLMERRALPANAGMLFLYKDVQSESSAFWMFRTRIPLDIAFIDSVGTIRTIHTMTPCTATLIQGCQNYPAGARWQAALEVNAGFFSRAGIGVGDRVLLRDTVTPRSPTG